MAGRVIYSFPVVRAMELGLVKRLRAVVLNPKTLRYVRREGDSEIEVGLDEVRRLGEEDADFRRSIRVHPLPRLAQRPQHPIADPPHQLLHVGMLQHTGSAQP